MGVREQQWCGLEEGRQGEVMGSVPKSHHETNRDESVSNSDLRSTEWKLDQLVLEY